MVTATGFEPVEWRFLVIDIGFAPIKVLLLSMRDRCLTAWLSRIHFQKMNSILHRSRLKIFIESLQKWRCGWDSNPRGFYTTEDFKSTPLWPLRHRTIMLILRSINRISNPWYCQSGIIFAIIRIGGVGGIRTLATVISRPNPLAGGPLHQLEYRSIIKTPFR